MPDVVQPADRRPDRRGWRWRVGVVSVEVGFEPTDELPHHTLSSTARHRPPEVHTVRHVLTSPPRGQWRTPPDGGE